MKILNAAGKGNEQMELFRRKLELFRTHYKNIYGISPDDEVLYLFMRMNEMQTDLKKDIKAVSEIRFNNSWDYFMYALGSSLKFLWILLTALVLSSAIVYYTDHRAAFHEKYNTEIIKASDSLSTKPASTKNKIQKPEKRKGK